MTDRRTLAGTDDGSSVDTPQPSSMGRALLFYSAQRLLLFLTTAVVLAAVGLRGLPLLGTAILISAVVSLFLLRGQRDTLTRAVAARDEARRSERQRLRSRLDEDDAEA